MSLIPKLNISLPAQYPRPGHETDSQILTGSNRFSTSASWACWARARRSGSARRQIRCLRFYQRIAAMLAATAIRVRTPSARLARSAQEESRLKDTYAAFSPETAFRARSPPRFEKSTHYFWWATRTDRTHRRAQTQHTQLTHSLIHSFTPFTFSLSHTNAHVLAHKHTRTHKQAFPPVCTLAHMQ